MILLVSALWLYGLSWWLKSLTAYLKEAAQKPHTALGRENVLPRRKRILTSATVTLDILVPTVRNMMPAIVIPAKIMPLAVISHRSMMGKMQPAPACPVTLGDIVKL